MHSRLLVAGLLLAVAGSGHGFCFHAYGGVGEYSAECDDSIEMEACYARCNCWTDFPDMGGQITHEVDAWCFQEACWCSYDQVLVSGVVTQYTPVSAGRLPLRHPEDGPVLLHQGRHHL